MPTKSPPPIPEPIPEPIPAEDQRAARIRAWEARRAARGRGPDGTLRWDITGAGEQRGPTYDVSGVGRAAGPPDDITVTHVQG